MKEQGYWRSTFSEADGTGSMKRLSAFILLLLLCFDVIWGEVNGHHANTRVLLIISANFLVLLGLATLPQIMELVAKIKSCISPAADTSNTNADKKD